MELGRRRRQVRRDLGVGGGGANLICDVHTVWGERFDQVAQLGDPGPEPVVFSPGGDGVVVLPGPEADELSGFLSVLEELRPAAAGDVMLGPLGQVMPGGDEIVLAVRERGPFPRV